MQIKLIGQSENGLVKFFHHFKKDIRVKGEIGVMLPGSTDGGGWMSMDLDDIIRGEPEYSLWQTRDRRWYDYAKT